MAIDEKFWLGRRVLVTGHTGFKGSWLCIWLQSLGAELVGYALGPPSDPNLYTLGVVSDDMIDQRADVRDLNSLVGTIKDHAPEIVFHLAAQAFVRPSYANPEETYGTNVMGTVNLLEAVRQVGGVRAIVIVTSDKCYENLESQKGYREIDRMGGRDPYSSSKGCAELIVAAFRHSYFSGNDNFTQIASARAGNIIGGGDWGVDRLIPDMVKAFNLHKAAIIRYPDAIRPWQHVLEPIAGYLILAQNLVINGGNFAEGWNFGPSSAGEQTVRYLADTMVEIWGDDAHWEIDGEDQPHEARYLQLDVTKAESHLGWRSHLDLRKTLELTVDWYRKWERGENMRAVTICQIQDYAEKMRDKVIS